MVAKVNTEECTGCGICADECPASAIVVEKEKAKVEVKILNTDKEIKAKEKTLSNKEFVKKAPEEIVEKEKTRLDELREALKKLKAVKDGLR